MNFELSELRSHPPMTADALVVLANEFLSGKGVTLVSKRTLRFYTAQDVVPSPMGSPKFARYGYEHLLSLLAARCLQDQGRRLEQIKRETQEIHRGRLDRLEGVVTQWLGQGRQVSGRVMSVRETASKESGADPFVKLADIGSALIRIPLSPSVTLEVADTHNLTGDLQKAQKELARIIDEFEAKSK